MRLPISGKTLFPGPTFTWTFNDDDNELLEKFAARNETPSSTLNPAVKSVY